MKMKFTALSFLALFTFSFVSAKEPVDSVETHILDDIHVLSSFVKNRFSEPAVVNTVTGDEILKKLGNQEFPEILKSTPSVYTSKMGGGFGDSRMTMRGFASDNIALLINGIPVNGMENGSVYWSNWSGLADISRDIQVQRGLGLSKLGLYSVGGTVNIITEATSVDPYGWIHYGIGNDGYQKMGVNFSSGETKDGWAISLMGTRTTGNGYVNGTNFEGWSYFASLSKRFGSNHRLSFTAFGAPQWHNRRSNKQFIEDYDNHRDGIRMNTAYGYINDKITPTYSGYNKYHKPQLSLNHFWTINKRSSLSTSVYASMATGGGRKVYGKDANRIQYNYKNGRPNSNTDLTADGLIDYNPLMESNRNSDHGSDAVFTMGTNSHDWYGLLSTYTNNFTNGLSLSAGVDFRYYKGYHYDTISDLLGGSYFKDNQLAWRNPTTELKVGDKVSQDYMSKIAWLGAFAQLSYSNEFCKAFVSVTATNHMFQREDPGKYGEFGNKTNFPISEVKTKWKTFIPMGVKAGFNYQISKTQRVFINGGYVTRAPLLENVYMNNDFIQNAVKEKIGTVELGYNFRNRKVDVLVNAYYTKWMDKSTTKNIGSWNGPKACIPDLDAVHKGIELEVTYRPIEKLRLGGFLSIGDWKWKNDINFVYYDDQNIKVGEYNAYIDGLHVGNAPQTSVMISASWEVMKNLSFGADFNHYSRFYADFSAIDRTNPNDKTDSWKIPSFGTVDLNANYGIQLGKIGLQIFATANNILNKKYICEAVDGANHDSATALVWYGFGTTWTTGVRMNF